MAFDNRSKLANILPNRLNFNDIGDIGDIEGGALEVRIVCEALAELCQFFSVGDFLNSRVRE